MRLFNNTDRGSTFGSINGKLRFSFGLTSVLIMLLIALFYWSDQKDERLDRLYARLERINLKIEQASNLEKQFLIEESINPTFYETGNSNYVQTHTWILEEIKLEVTEMDKNPELQGLGLRGKIDSIQAEIDSFAAVFDTLVASIKARGFKSYGYEGDLRQAISRVTNAGYELDMEKVLSIRRREKDYILRKEQKYIDLLQEEVADLEKSIQASIRNPTGKAYLLSSLELYLKSFRKFVEVDKLIGFRQDQGLNAKLNSLSYSIEEKVMNLGSEVRKHAEEQRTNLEVAVLIISILFMLLNFVLSSFTTRTLSRPMESLSGSIHEVIESNFEKKASIGYSKRRDEIGALSRDFQLMMDRMTDRTNALLVQQEKTKEALESVRSLGQLGQKLASTLKIDEILSISFESLGRLVDISIMWVGIYDKEDDSLHYQGAVKGETGSQSMSIPLSQIESDLGVWAFKRQEEVVIQDFDKERSMYANYQPQGEYKMKTVIYLPLSSGGKQIGVFSLQHEKPNAFSEFQLDIVRGLASYLVVALDNALIYAGLESTVQERTFEVEQQKEELEAQKERLEHSVETIRLLSDIGRRLTSHLSVENIVSAAYEQVQGLMDTLVFGIGIYDRQKDSLRFSSSIEDGKVLPAYEYQVKVDTDSYSVQCFQTAQDIIINDLEEAQVKKGMPIADHLNLYGKGTPQSIIYLPLQAKGQTVGIITVQSMAKNAYSENHVYLLRNIGVYAAIALENAQNYQQIEKQKDAIDTSAKKINASINYAKRIQESLLPNMESVQKALPESFVLLRPRDVVSGDFFWFNSNANKIYIAALDCTGHGVPGAFMSMIGNELLNEAVLRMEMENPADILYHLHKGVRAALRQYETENRDGMDMSVSVIDQEKQELIFSGARSPLIYIQKDELTQLKGDQYPIGGEQREKRRVFSAHTIDISEPTMIYQFSDGYQDQFGGPNGRKFMKKRLRELFMDIYQKPVPEQGRIMEGVFKQWIGSKFRQIDDVLVVGARVGGKKAQ